MRALKQTLAVLAVAALVVPVTSAAFAASPESGLTDGPVAPSEQHPAQSFVVAGGAEVTLDRGTYSVEVIAPQPTAVVPADVAPVDTSADVAPADTPAGAATPSFGAPPQSYSGENVLAYAWQFVGKVPYGPGNDPNDSFSCDGYVQYVFKGFGIHLPRGANQQAALGVPIPASEARAGDLLWWPDTHIAIYDGNGGMLDSPYEGLMVRHRADLWNDPIFIRLG